MGEGGGGEEKFLSFTSLPFSLPFFPFSPETPDTQARSSGSGTGYGSRVNSQEFMHVFIVSLIIST